MPVMDASHTQELIELEENFGAHNYHPLDVVIERAEESGFTTSKASAIWIAWLRIRQSIKGIAIPAFSKP